MLSVVVIPIDSFAPLVLILLGAMVVLFVRIFSKIYDKTLFGDEAVLYQSLPLSAEEVVVAKTFVGTVAATIGWSGIMSSLAVGMTVLGLETSNTSLCSLSLDLLNEFDVVSVLNIVLKLVADGFFVAATLFATSVSTKVIETYAMRAFSIAVFLIALSFQRKYLPYVVISITGVNIFLASAVEIAITLAIGICASLITKYCLDKKYILS